jgi:mannosyltransferase OCH1-like enzyme
MNITSRPLKFLVNRLIKMAANSMKAGYYLVHLIVPGMRFTIPRSSPALIRRRADKRIPRILWQTNFTDRVTFPVFLNYKFNRLMSLSYDYRLMTDEDCLEFIRARYPGPICRAYENLRIGASRADLWRMLVLKEHGGVYLDMDAHLMWPLEALIARDDRELFVLDRSSSLTNFFLASERGNPLVDATIEKIMDNIRANATNNVFDMTGPGAVMSAVADAKVNVEAQRFVCDQGNFTNEFFQYADYSFSKWHQEQKKSPLLFRSGAQRERSGEKVP